MTSNARALSIAAVTVAALVGTAAVAGSHDSLALSGVGSVAGSSPATQPDNRDMNVPGNHRTSAGSAQQAQQTGIVTVVSVLKYQQAESAGTGMVLTANGEILTNNHVIDGATRTRVTVVSTGHSYRADVVGTDPTDDVAVLQLRRASGLATANIGDSSGVSVGDSVVGVGNAGGSGALTASRGSVTALNQSITASDGGGQNPERLTGLIEIDAPIISGDSGGPLYNSAGEIIGMNTAASSGHATTAAYAIPIDDAMKIAGEIETGVETTAIHIGYPGFLGIGTITASGGVGVGSVLPGGPAGRAGIPPGSVIHSIDGKAVRSGTGLRTLLGTYDPGTSVTVVWTDPNGQRHSGSVTLATGPAD